MPHYTAASASLHALVVFSISFGLFFICPTHTHTHTLSPTNRFANLDPDFLGNGLKRFSKAAPAIRPKSLEEFVCEYVCACFRFCIFVFLEGCVCMILPYSLCPLNFM